MVSDISRISVPELSDYISNVLVRCFPWMMIFLLFTPSIFSYF